MKWVTYSHVHLTVLSCAWVIRRFVDSEAEFLFVPESQVKEVATQTGAIPFNVPDVELGPHEGRCSFESIMLKYELKDPALARLAKIVRPNPAAVINRDPIRLGLAAIARGYGLRYPDDGMNLEREYEVYDALYAWCRLEVAKS